MVLESGLASDQIFFGFLGLVACPLPAPDLVMEPTWHMAVHGNLVVLSVLPNHDQYVREALSRSQVYSHQVVSDGDISVWGCALDGLRCGYFSSLACVRGGRFHNMCAAGAGANRQTCQRASHLALAAMCCARVDHPTPWACFAFATPAAQDFFVMLVLQLKHSVEFGQAYDHIPMAVALVAVDNIAHLSEMRERERERERERRRAMTPAERASDAERGKCRFPLTACGCTSTLLASGRSQMTLPCALHTPQRWVPHGNEPQFFCSGQRTFADSNRSGTPQHQTALPPQGSQTSKVNPRCPAYSWVSDA